MIAWILRRLFKLVIFAMVAIVAVILALIYAPQAVRDSLAYVGDKINVGSKKLAPALVAERPVEKCKWLKQSWSDEDRAWFHNVSQGTATFPVPYAWFKELERPEFTLAGFVSRQGLTSDADYLARLGFIAPNKDCDPVAGADAPQGANVLPVGFAVLKGWTDPVTGLPQKEDALGLTCAACHTGQIHYNGTSLRIDGAPAMIDLANLERVIGLSICYADAFPTSLWRKSRFIDAILDGKKLTGEARDKERDLINDELGRTCNNEVSEKVKAEYGILQRRQQVHAEEGFGRLDALNRIGNQVFHDDLADPDKPGTPPEGFSVAEFDGNFAAHSAPVSFPPIWDVPHFLWAQYDASILDPRIRNVGEAIGVAAKLNMSAGDPAHPPFSSTAAIDVIGEVETRLQGKSPFVEPIGFKGLLAPDWKEAADTFPGDPKWALDPDKIVLGRKLYGELCVECHAGPVRDPEIPASDPRSFWMDPNWTTLPSGEKLFNPVQKTVAAMGTDPEQARVLTARQVKVPDNLGIDVGRDILEKCKMPNDPGLRKSFALNLMAVVSKVDEEWARSKGQQIPEGRPNCPNPKVFVPVVNADAAPGSTPRYLVKPHYRARPLDGVWATAPYLHNGSVPTLDDMLKPQAERPSKFCVGPLEFDPVKVGLSGGETESCEAGLTLLDTQQRGNSNRGHSFEAAAGIEDAALPAGVLGRKLTEDERSALVEYLKML